MFYTGVFTIKEKYSVKCYRFVPDSFFCSLFVHLLYPCEGHRGVYRICICTLQHTRFSVLPILVYTMSNTPW